MVRRLLALFTRLLVMVAAFAGLCVVRAQSAPLSADPEVLAMIDRLRATPVLYNMDTEAVHAIFERGQQLGNRADVFTYIGDSNSTGGDFLYPMGFGDRYCELGSYSDLQATLDYFSADSPRAGQRNSFTNHSLAADNGLSSAGALDPFWATEPCASNESPVMCEYRLTKPSVAIILLGLMDVRYSTSPEVYHDNMEQIVQLSVEQGVIPALTTNVVLPDQQTLSFDLSIRQNNALLDIVDAHQTPLINLWAAAEALPDFGIGPDRTHLKAEVGAYCSFDGQERQVGGTLRNLLTLQALDELRRTVLHPNGL